MIRSLEADRIEYQYPHSLIDFRGPLTCEFLSRKLNEEKRILSGMMKGKNPDKKEMRSQEYRIDYLERLIKKL